MQLELPLWVIIGVSILVGIAALTGVVIVIRTVAIVTKSYLLLVELSETLKTLKELAPVIFDLARQFKNDSGSSALDKIEKLERDGVLRKEDAEVIKDALRNIRAEQVALALKQDRMPATSQTVHIGGDAVGDRKKIGGDEVKGDKKIEGTIKGTLTEKE